MSFQGARLSELSVCPKRCALGALGTPRPEPSDYQRKIWDRGRYDQRWIADRYKARYGARSVKREVEVPWPLGTGHIDLWIPKVKQIVEIKSGVPRMDAAIKQVKLQLRYFPRAEHGVVFVLDPKTLDDKRTYVKLTETDVEAIDAEVEKVQAAVSTGEALPACTFSTPAECRNAWCDFTDVAWADWTPPDPENLDEVFADAVAEMVNARTMRDFAKAELDAVDARWKAACARLSELGLEPGTDYRCNGYTVRRTLVSGRETFSLSRAKKSGLWTSLHDSYFEGFVSISEPSERWSVKAADDVANDHATLGHVST